MMSSRVRIFKLACVTGVLAFTALLVWIATVSVMRLRDVVGDRFFSTQRSAGEAWDAGPVPRIDVELYSGNISAVQSTDGRVSAVITTTAVVRDSQAGADAAANSIALQTDRDGHTIRIRAANPRNSPALSLRTDLALRVPEGASLDLLTGHGYIHIGQCLPSRDRGQWMSSPVALKAVRARDLGDSYAGIEVEIRSRASAPPTVLDLESRRGSIGIKGDNVLIRAKANGGGVEYSGQPAPGVSSIVTGRYSPHADEGWRLARGIRVVMPADTAFEVDASASEANVLSEIPFRFATPRQPSLLVGAVGSDPKIRISLRSADGPIEVVQILGAMLAPGVGTR
jgi:hypothetical protein